MTPTTKVLKVYATVPAEGYVGMLQTTRVPVVAWAYVQFESEGEKFRGWDGIGVWNDGPEFFSVFPYFQGFEPIDSRT